jgi:hypothetical protein
MTAKTIKDNAAGLGLVRVAFDVPRASFDALDNDISDVLEAVHDAGMICDFIASGLATGCVTSDEPALMPILRMMGNTLRGVRERQGASLDMLDTLFRHARGDIARAELATMKGEAA